MMKRKMAEHETRMGRQEMHKNRSLENHMKWRKYNVKMWSCSVQGSKSDLSLGIDLLYPREIMW